MIIDYLFWLMIIGYLHSTIIYFLPSITSSHLFSSHFSSSQFFSPLFTSFHPFSLLLTSSRLFSPLLVSSRLISPLLASSCLFSPLHASSRLFMPLSPLITKNCTYIHTPLVPKLFILFIFYILERFIRKVFISLDLYCGFKFYLFVVSF